MSKKLSVDEMFTMPDDKFVCTNFTSAQIMRQRFDKPDKLVICFDGHPSFFLVHERSLDPGTKTRAQLEAWMVKIDDHLRPEVVQTIAKESFIGLYLTYRERITDPI